MLVITLQREKCIGCTFCKERAPDFFRLTHSDGKAVLLHSKEKKGFFTLKTHHDEAFEALEQASKSCPVRIIKVTKL